MRHSVPSSPPSSEPGNVELVRRAASDARELIRLEVALARDEITHDLASAKTSAISAAVAVVLGLTGFAVLVVTLGVALGPLGTLVVALVLLAGAALSAWVAYRSFPTKALAATGDRLKEDKAVLKEHLS